MFFVTFLCLAFCRQIEIKANATFEFFDKVDKGDLYKFIYNTKGDATVSFYDPLGRFILTDSSRTAALYTKVLDEGKLKMVVQNNQNTPISFSYKCPDPNKEMIGHLGYIKDVDLVSNLTRLLDQLVEDQKLQVQRTREHQKMVEKSRFWTRILMIVELVLTGLAVFLLHRDFVAMFEKKQSL